MNATNVANFRPAEESISWAKADIADLKSGFDKFFSECKISIVEEFNESIGLNLTMMRVTGDVSLDSIKRHAVAALLNTRNSFDQAVNIAGASLTKKRFKKNFPWSCSLSDLESHRLKDFPEKLRDAIKPQEPYPRGDAYAGGNNLIRALARLANNKHSVGFTVDGRGGFIRTGDINFTGMGPMPRFALYPPNWDPVKQQVVLFAMSSEGVNVKFADNARLGFDVCFEISELANPPNVMFALQCFLAASERNLKFMKAACAGGG